MFPPPVVFPATREVMEGYKTVSILHISQGCTHALSTQPAHEAPLHLDQNLFNIQLLSSSHEPRSSYRPHITTILHFIFDTQGIPISPLTNISAARPSCSAVLQALQLVHCSHQSVSTPDSGLSLVTSHHGLKIHLTTPGEQC